MEKIWQLYPTLPPALAQTTGLPSVLGQILYNRKITDAGQVRELLDQEVHDWHDPILLPDMEKAIDRLETAIELGHTIGVFGDFDVDGVTATTLLACGLTDLGAKVAPYIPHRVSEGHGLNKEAIQALKASGVSLLVTVDCGVTSHEEVELAADLGMDVIITDHHTPAPNLPPAIAVVDPKVPGCNYPFQELTGAGLAFKLMQGLCDRLGCSETQDMAALAALGTVADLAPLQGENRSIVKRGLKGLQSTSRPGLQALYRKAGLLPENINTEAIAFSIAPRLNASGRLQHAIASYRLLMAESTEEAEALATQIDDFNKERQRITEDAYQLAKKEALSLESLPPVLIMASEHFFPGISGLVASRLVEDYYRPAIVVALDENLARASGRSIPGFDLVGALYSCQDLFDRFGGHPMAAGFVMRRDNLPLLQERLMGVAAAALKQVDLTPILWIDAESSPSGLMGDTYKQLMALEPFGMGNPVPLFLARNLTLISSKTMGRSGQHLRMKVNDGIASWDAVAFRQGYKRVANTRKLDMVYSITTQVWGGQKVLSLRVVDFQPSGD